MKSNKIRLRGRQYDANAPKSYKTIQRQIQKRLRLEKGEEETQDLEEPELNLPESLDNLSVDTENTFPEDEIYCLADVNPELPLTKTQKKRTYDQKLVEEFYKNPTDINFQKIWKRFYPGVKRYAFKLMGDNSRADDMVQDTFQRAWEQKDAYDPKKSRYITWLYIICRNFCLDTLENDSRTSAIDIDINDLNDNIVYAELIENKHIEDTHYIVDSKTNLVRKNSSDEVIEKMYDASVREISKFDPIFQRIISMKELDNMSISDIADELSVSESKIKNVYYKTKDVLAKKITRKNSELFFEFQQAMINNTKNTFNNIFKNNSSDDTEDYFAEFYS